MSDFEEAYWLGYLAGGIDYDGSIIISKRMVLGKGQIRKTPQFQPSIKITNNCLEVLEVMHQKYGGHIYPSGKGYELRFTSRQELLSIVESVKLIIKGEQLEVIQQALNIIPYKYNIYGRRGRPIWMIAKLDNLYKKMKELNRRYKSGFEEEDESLPEKV